VHHHEYDVLIDLDIKMLLKLKIEAQTVQIDRISNWFSNKFYKQPSGWLQNFVIPKKDTLFDRHLKAEPNVKK
jgi:hypothetical protein